jgi:GxxExxY protein
MSNDFWSFRAGDHRRLDDGVESIPSKVIGAAIEVHKVLSAGLPEIAYKRSLSHELMLCDLPHLVEAPVPVHYKGMLVAEGRVDLLVYGRLVVELKVVEQLNEVHTAQVIAYLNALDLELGLLLNFNVSVMKQGIKRVIRTRN